MATADSTPLTSRHSAVRSIVTAGVFVGILDGTAACVHAYLASGVSPVRVFQFIASKVVGSEAFANTYWAIPGLLIHFFIAHTWAAVYFYLYPRLRGLSKNQIINGVLYGVFVWLMMNLAVLPVVNGALPSFKITALIGICIHMTMVGLPIAIIIGRYYDRRE